MVKGLIDKKNLGVIEKISGVFWKMGLFPSKKRNPSRRRVFDFF